MIIPADYLRGRAEFSELPDDIQDNITRFLLRLNCLGSQYWVQTGKRLKINDGYRRPEDADRYGAKKSNHLKGLAGDIDDDEHGQLWFWCARNLAFIAGIGLFMEDPRWTHGAVGSWIHFQSVPPGSGKRIYIPTGKPAPAAWLWDGVYNHDLDVPRETGG